MGVLNRKTHRVLLVSKDKCNISRLRDQLHFPFVECETVLDAGAAKKILTSRTIDVLVIDSDMEGTCPDQCIKKFIENTKSDFRNLKVVVFNGVSNRTLQRRIRRCGADGYLSSRNNMKNVAVSVKRLLEL